jgi:hypothetical protein
MLGLIAVGAVLGIAGWIVAEGRAKPAPVPVRVKTKDGKNAEHR